MEKDKNVDKVMDEAYNNKGKRGYNNKYPKKKKFYKKNNWSFIVNIILKVIEVGALIAIWYELYLSNTISFD